jgi:hypothetical protein
MIDLGPGTPIRQLEASTLYYFWSINARHRRRGHHVGYICFKGMFLVSGDTYQDPSQRGPRVRSFLLGRDLRLAAGRPTSSRGLGRRDRCQMFHRVCTRTRHDPHLRQGPQRRPVCSQEGAQQAQHAISSRAYHVGRVQDWGLAYHTARQGRGPSSRTDMTTHLAAKPRQICESRLWNRVRAAAGSAGQELTIDMFALPRFRVQSDPGRTNKEKSRSTGSQQDCGIPPSSYAQCAASDTRDRYRVVFARR